MNAWVFCRNTQVKLKYLLDYQEEILTKYAQSLNLKVIGVSKLIYKEIDYNNYQIGEMINHILHKKIQIILLYDKSCMTSNEEEFIEFEMLCQSHNVKIIALRS